MNAPDGSPRLVIGLVPVYAAAYAAASAVARCLMAQKEWFSQTRLGLVTTLFYTTLVE